jgi:group I intron endonuclease
MDSGIYQIVNNVNQKRYIGYAKSIKGRWLKHKRKLYLGIHKNQHLQLAWNMYGKHNFNFEILEYCTIDILSIREDYWAKILKVHNPEYGYNLKDTGPNESYRHNQETIEKIRKANTGRTYPNRKGRSQSQETKKLLSDKGKLSYRKYNTLETRQRISEGVKRQIAMKKGQYKKHRETTSIYKRVSVAISCLIKTKCMNIQVTRQTELPIKCYEI